MTGKLMIEHGLAYICIFDPKEYTDIENLGTATTSWLLVIFPQDGACEGWGGGIVLTATFLPH